MFEGVYTALVTPFTRDDAVDYEALGRLIDRQLSEGVDGFVPVGTTGESPTLGVEEHQRVIEFTVERTAGRAKVIAGTGANATSEALSLTRHAQQAGADGCLQVAPYYNKPNQMGLIRHFSAVADLGLPVVLYNIPGRTGIDIEPATVAELARHPSIVAIKEATGSVDRVSRYLDSCDIEVLSGDDPLTLPMMVVGGVGVISVAANVVPGLVSEMVHAALDGRWAEARTLHARLYPLFKDLFIDTNPIPVKAALAMMGQIEELYRLPLCAMTDERKAQLRRTLEATGLL